MHSVQQPISNSTCLAALPKPVPVAVMLSRAVEAPLVTMS